MYVSFQDNCCRTRHANPGERCAPQWTSSDANGRSETTEASVQRRKTHTESPTTGSVWRRKGLITKIAEEDGQLGSDDRRSPRDAGARRFGSDRQTGTRRGRYRSNGETIVRELLRRIAIAPDALPDAMGIEMSCVVQALQGGMNVRHHRSAHSAQARKGCGHASCRVVRNEHRGNECDQVAKPPRSHALASRNADGSSAPRSFKHERHANPARAASFDLCQTYRLQGPGAWTTSRSRGRSIRPSLTGWDNPTQPQTRAIAPPRPLRFSHPLRYWRHRLSVTGVSPEASTVPISLKPDPDLKP